MDRHLEPADLLCQAETAMHCAMGMTTGAASVIEHAGTDEQRERYLSLLMADDWDSLGSGAMFLTEKQGGSDLGPVSTVAHKADDGTWRLDGDKWFCSNVDADVILTLARPEGA